MRIELGGINIPIVPPAAIAPVASAGLYLYFFISGKVTRPIVAAVATLEALTAAKPAHAPTVAIARPPL